MTLRVGIDLDNTIACYDGYFSHFYAERGGTKERVKASLLREPNGEAIWQRIQGELYGKHMSYASVFPGFFEFLELAKQGDIELVIVSHKSEYGHLDATKTPLRKMAFGWLADHNIEIPVFFESTRTEKVHRIKELRCDYFIDDLPEVFEDFNFPQFTKSILFEPQKNTWRMIGKQIFGEWQPEQILSTFRQRFPWLNISSVLPVVGRQNSRVFKMSNGKQSFALKIYPDLGTDPRPRLKTEYQASLELSQRGFPVLTPVAKDQSLNWGVYDWIQGEAPLYASELFIEKAAKFIQRLKHLSETCDETGLFGNASENCLGKSDLDDQIVRRYERMRDLRLSELNNFRSQFERLYLKFKKSHEEIIRPVLSPSDFGTHNTIERRDGESVFIDLEYFGWDDSVKLVSDFYWHPAMNLSVDLRRSWIKKVTPLFDAETGFKERLRSQLPLYALRWSLIICNQINPDQIKKAEQLLAEVEHGPTI